MKGETTSAKWITSKRKPQNLAKTKAAKSKKFPKVSKPRFGRARRHSSKFEWLYYSLGILFYLMRIIETNVNEFIAAINAVPMNVFILVLLIILLINKK